MKIRNSKNGRNGDWANIQAPSQRHSNKISFEQKLMTPMERQRDSMKWPIVATAEWEKF